MLKEAGRTLCIFVPLIMQIEKEKENTEEKSGRGAEHKISLTKK